MKVTSTSQNLKKLSKIGLHKKMCDMIEITKKMDVIK